MRLDIFNGWRRITGCVRLWIFQFVDLVLLRLL